MGTELEDFVENLKNQISILLKSESNGGADKFKALIELEDTLKNIEISQEYFNVKRQYLKDFKSYLFAYNTGGSNSFIDEINERAKHINTYLIRVC